MSTLVSGGRAASVMTFQLSKPTMATCAGHVDAALAQRLGGAAGDLVVAAEHRVGRRPLAVEQLRRPRRGPSLRPGAAEIDRRRRGVEAGRAQRADDSPGGAAARPRTARAR